MKKLFIALALMVFALGVNAQTGRAISLKSVYSLSSDTVTNTGTVYLEGRVADKGAVAIQVNITKISGTVAGTATLYGSVNGSTYQPVDTVDAPAYTLTNVTSQGIIWHIDKSYLNYYRVSITGSGTMAASFTSDALIKEY